MSAVSKVVQVHERRSSLPQEIARTILGGFDRHYGLFRQASIDAKGLFERAAWAEMRSLARERIQMYDKRVQEGMNAWMAWGEKHKDAIVQQGAPLGKTKRVGLNGVTDIKNAMAGWVLVQAETHEAAARMFEGHPHFTIFPGDSVEIMECLPIPQM